MILNVISLLKRLKNKLKGMVKKMEQRAAFKKNMIYVHKKSFIDGSVKIGYGTRINNISHIGPCTIGRYCACGGRLVVRSENHYTNYLNMQDWIQKEIGSNVRVAGKSKGEVIIGDASWIGDSVIILPGVRIGTGAVIGAGAVVTKDIPEFGIAVGNPAKVIAMRFDDDIISFIKELAWWDWPINKIKANKDLFEIDFGSISIEDAKRLIIK